MYNNQDQVNNTGNIRSPASGISLSNKMATSQYDQDPQQRYNDNNKLPPNYTPIGTTTRETYNNNPVSQQISPSRPNYSVVRESTRALEPPTYVSQVIPQQQTVYVQQPRQNIQYVEQPQVRKVIQQPVQMQVPVQQVQVPVQYQERIVEVQRPVYVDNRQEIDGYRNKINQLETEIAALRNTTPKIVQTTAYIEDNTRIQSLEGRITVLLNEVEKLNQIIVEKSQQVEHWHSRYLDIEKDLGDFHVLERENLRLKEILDLRQRDLDTYRLRFNEWESRINDINSYEEEVKRLQNLLLQKSREIDDLRLRVSESEYQKMDSIGYENEVRRLTEALRKREYEMEDLRRQSSLKDNFTSYNREYEQKIQTLTEEIARLKARQVIAVASPQATSPIRTIAVNPGTTTTTARPVIVDSPRRNSYNDKIDDGRYNNRYTYSPPNNRK